MYLNFVVKDVVFERFGEKERIYLLLLLDIKEIYNLMNKLYMIMIDLGGF